MWDWLIKYTPRDVVGTICFIIRYRIVIIYYNTLLKAQVKIEFCLILDI